MKSILLFLLTAVLAIGADIKVRDITTTRALPAANDYLLVDGATLGTAKALLFHFPQITTTRTTLAAFSVTSVADNTTVQTLGGSSLGDGLGSLYYYSSASTATPNGTTVIQPTVGSGRWLIVLSNTLPPPTAVTLGGVFSKAGVTHQYLSALDTSGNFTLTAVSAADVSGLGTMATQNASAVAITGGTIDGTTVGATTAALGRFSAIRMGTGGSGYNVDLATGGVSMRLFDTNASGGALILESFSQSVAGRTAIGGSNDFRLSANSNLVVAMTGTSAAFAVDTSAPVRSAGSTTSRNITARFAEEINALDYGCDNTGATSNDAALLTIYNVVLQNDGTVPELLLSRYIGGFTIPPSNSWTGRPSLTLTGGLSGASGFQAYGNINPGGYMVSVEVANMGTGYNVLTYACTRTNGSPTITLGSGTFDARIVAGTSVRFESVTTSCRVLTRNSNTSLTLTENMTFSNTDQFVFGMPVPNINGTPAPSDIIPVVGKKRVVRFPPGSYQLTGWPSLGGLSNVDFIATGAQFLFTPVTGTAGPAIRNCTAINWTGGDFMFQGSRFMIPTSRQRYPGQEGFAIGGSQYITVKNATTWSAFEFGFVAGGDGTTNNAYWGQWIKFDGCRSITPLGDGFHVTTGNQWVRITNCETIMPGDDAFAVVNDWQNPARNPTDIEYNTCRVSGGLYRGCVALGSNYVRFINITGRDTHGPFLWALQDGGFAAPSNVTFENIVAENLGNTSVSTLDGNSGCGIRAESMAGLHLRNLSFKQDSTALGNAPVWLVVDSTITDLDWPGRRITSTSGVVTFAGSPNTDLNCTAGNGFASVFLEGGHRYKVTGTISARSSVGTTGTFWAVFTDGSSEFGGGSSFQFSTIAERTQLSAEAIIEVQPGFPKNINFLIKQGGGGVTLDAGVTAGISAEIVATQID